MISTCSFRHKYNSAIESPVFVGSVSSKKFNALGPFAMQITTAIHIQINLLWSSPTTAALFDIMPVLPIPEIFSNLHIKHKTLIPLSGRNPIKYFSPPLSDNNLNLVRSRNHQRQGSPPSFNCTPGFYVIFSPTHIQVYNSFRSWLWNMCIVD